MCIALAQKLRVDQVIWPEAKVPAFRSRVYVDTLEVEKKPVLMILFHILTVSLVLNFQLNLRAEANAPEYARDWSGAWISGLVVRRPWRLPRRSAFVYSLD